MYPSSEKQNQMLSTCDTKLTAVNGSEAKQLGFVDIPVCFDDSDWFTERFYVCETEGPAILSCNMSEKLGIISVTESRNISV